MQVSKKRMAGDHKPCHPKAVNGLVSWRAEVGIHVPSMSSVVSLG